MQSQIPFFSIITAIKDGLEYFRETAPTILSQNFQDWEWIVIDDGSVEPIGEYLRSLNDPRIRYFRNEKSLGQTRSLNFAIDQSRSSWLVRMDGDDLADPRRLELTRNAVLKLDPKNSQNFQALLFSDYKVITEAGEVITTVSYRSPITEKFYNYLFKNNPICHPSVTFYKYSPDGKVYHFDEALRNAQDYALWKKIKKDYPLGFCHLNSPLISYRLVTQSLSGARAGEQRAELKNIRKAMAGENVTPAEHVQKLGLSEQQGMYAYRQLYYRFIGTSNVEVSKEISSLFTCLGYPRMAGRAIFYFIGTPVRKFLKPWLFSGIYR